MMSKNYGLIGCGMMGVEHIRNIALLDGAHIHAVYDPHDDLAQRAAQIADGALPMVSVDALIKNPDLDAIIISSPNHVHVDQLEQIANNRSIPILCEKPLFTKPEDKQRIEYLQARYPAPIWVAMEYRYMPPIAALIESVDSVTGGVKMLSLQEHRFPFLEKVDAWNRFNKNTGGTLVEKCCHFFDLMRLILKSEPVQVMASAGQLTNHKDESYHGQIPDIWDSGYVVMDFANGAKAMLELCMFADGAMWNEEISAVGPKGKILCQVPGPQRFWPPNLGQSPEPQLTVYPRHPVHPTTQIIPLDKEHTEIGDHHGSTYFQHKKFLTMIVEGGTPEVTVYDGVRAVEMGLKAQQAALEQRVINFE